MVYSKYIQLTTVLFNLSQITGGLMSKSILGWLIIGLIITSTVLIVGCATIFKGSDATINITSTPTAAKVAISSTGGMRMFDGVTPAVVKLPKKNEYIVTISLSGYKDATVNILKDGIEGWFWGNLLCGGVIGIVVDLVTGAMNKLEPEQISVSLALAHNMKGEQVIYAVLYALDNEGQLRSLAVPLERN
jgi:hypothetical protein